MNNEELKKKIVDIALHAEWTDMFGDHNSIGKYAANAIADALVAARIGDVKEAEHRAEVAERALLIACANAVKDEKDDVNIELLVRVLYDRYLKQAEKELAEERKDEKLE